jgi:hypothetical protein
LVRLFLCRPTISRPASRKRCRFDERPSLLLLLLLLPQPVAVVLLKHISKSR